MTTLSAQLSSSIDTLASAIAAVTAEFPEQANSHALRRFFQSWHTRISAVPGNHTLYDLPFLESLSDHLKAPNHSYETIAKLVDDRPSLTSDLMIVQIKDLLSKFNSDWSKHEFPSRIRDIVTADPGNTVALLKKSLDVCNSWVLTRHSDLKEVNAERGNNLNQLRYRMMHQ